MTTVADPTHGDTSDGRVTRNKQLRTLFGEEELAEPRRLDRHTTVRAVFVCV